MDDRLGMTRREALAVTGGAALAAAGAAAAPATALTVEPQAGEGFDEEVDFVVAGSGTGIFAALAAEQAGKDVLLLEKSGMIGGTMALSGKAFWVPCNAFQAEGGVADTPEDAAAYMMECDPYGYADEDACLDCARNAETARTWLEENVGIPWKGYTPFMDYNAYPHCSHGRSVLFGADFASWKEQVAEENADIIRTNTAVSSLIVDADGAVTGVVAENGGATTRIRTRGGASRHRRL